jgi:hypothetical protein
MRFKMNTALKQQAEQNATQKMLRRPNGGRYPRRRLSSAGSSDRCNTSIKSFGWDFEAQSLTRPFIELPSHAVELRLRVRRQSLRFGKYCRSRPLMFSFDPRCQGLSKSGYASAVMPRRGRCRWHFQREVDRATRPVTGLHSHLQKNRLHYRTSYHLQLVGICNQINRRYGRGVL